MGCHPCTEERLASRLREQPTRSASPSPCCSGYAPSHARSLDRYRAYRPQQREEPTGCVAAGSKQVMTQFDTAGISPASQRR